MNDLLLTQNRRSIMSTILTGHKLIIAEDSNEIAVVNMDSKTASYTIKQGKSPATTQL